MRNYLSLGACLVIGIVLLAHRLVYPLNSEKPLIVTDWDALGYYMYLPGIVIYNDVAELKWFDAIDKKYAVSGGTLYQANKQDNGKYVFKYLGGVAILQVPLFLVGHASAKLLGYPADGFSSPYQHALAYGVIFYCLLALLLLRKILLWYFPDRVVAIVLILLCLATNFIQYAAVQGGMSHAYIFPLYVLMLYATVKWHAHPSIFWAALIGFLIGLATISRPTEAVMLFIPLFWGTHTKEAARVKWQMVKQYRHHVLFALAIGLLAILPQLIYWKSVTGSWIYDVGSSWRFLTPFFRVLFGWEKGWFIYTPVTLFFIAGFFFMGKYSFKKSVIWFCLLNIYIIIAWADWRYGASYSTRALVQSYPVFALPFAAFIERAIQSKWRFAVYMISGYLVFVNIFQVSQFNQTILQGDLTRKYYSHVYLDPHPSPLDMSLMDTDEVIDNEKKYTRSLLFSSAPVQAINFGAGQTFTLLPDTVLTVSGGQWLKLECSIKFFSHVPQGSINAEIQQGDSLKHIRIRLNNGIVRPNATNGYAFFMQLPQWAHNSVFRLYLHSDHEFNGIIEKLTITSFVN